MNTILGILNKCPILNADARPGQLQLVFNIKITCSCDLYPLHPTFYGKTGVYRGIHYFLIFALKHRLWVLIRNASVLMVTEDLCFEQKYENSKKKSSENCHFYSCENIAVYCMDLFS